MSARRNILLLLQVKSVYVIASHISPQPRNKNKQLTRLSDMQCIQNIKLRHNSRNFQARIFKLTAHLVLARKRSGVETSLKRTLDPLCCLHKKEFEPFWLPPLAYQLVSFPTLSYDQLTLQQGLQQDHQGAKTSH